MLFHEALHLVFTTFSRQVLQQGRLTAYLADCAVFDTFDDKRTICLTIDRYYGSRLYTCLSHSPYKANFDAIVQEVKLRHSNIDPQIVDYVFQSIRYAWGKIKSVRPPKPPVLFPTVKKKKHPRRKNNSTQLYTNLPNPTPRTKRPRRPSPPKRLRKNNNSTPSYTTLQHPTPRTKLSRRISPSVSSPNWKLLFKSIGVAILQIVLYVVLVQCLVGGFVFLIEGRWYGLIGMLIGVILIYILYRKYNP